MQKPLFIAILWLGLISTAPMTRAEPRPFISSAELERQIHQQINRERQNYGVHALDNDKHLAAVARHHSLDMAHHHFFSHINLQGETPSDRAGRQGWNEKKQLDPETSATGIAENIFLVCLYDKIYTVKQNGIIIGKEYEWMDVNRLVLKIVQGWMNSPSHRRVMLSPQYDRQGIGVAIWGYDVYVTEDLF